MGELMGGIAVPRHPQHANASIRVTLLRERGAFVIMDDNQNRAELLQELKQIDLLSLRDPELRRLMFLAHSEGLLAGLLLDVLSEDRQQHYPHLSLGQKLAPEYRSIRLPLWGRNYRRISFALNLLISLFGSSSWPAPGLKSSGEIIPPKRAVANSR